MSEIHFEKAKQQLLRHMQSLFEEIEKELALSHQEKYILLEDACESSSDAGELRVAFEQWYSDHAEDIGLDNDVDELWDHAMAGESSFDMFLDDDEFGEESEKEEDVLSDEEEDV